MLNPVTYAKDAYRGLQYGRVLTPSRIIRRVAPPRERTVAWVFEYGPTALPPRNDEAGLTDQILDILREFGARATFGVFGSTAKNYPDTPGRPGTKYATGRKYEHLPSFGLDDLAGAESNPELVRRIAREGHEPANYSYRNIPYAPDREMRLRHSLGSAAEAEADFRALHELVYSLTHYDMRFARPPRDIDVCADETPVFGLYEAEGYHRIAPAYEISNNDPDYAEMQIRLLLEENPDALSGMVIARRDGFDSLGIMPETETLRAELELLEGYGYRVLGVGELMERSPFEDVTPEMECFEAVRALDAAGFTLGFRNNRFYPDRELTVAEIDAFISPPHSRPKSVRIAGGETVRPRNIAARAEELYGSVRGQPYGTTRSGVAMWLAEIADHNGLLR